MALKLVVHGGVGSSAENPETMAGCVRAAEAGFDRLQRGAAALEAALAAAVVLEDDPQFNAGTGSSLQLDGTTVSMDAGLMDSEGRLGAVAAIQRVKNPILVARAVAETPHWLLAGEGAIAFARRMGFGDYYQVTERARRSYERVVRMLQTGETRDLAEAWRTFDIAAHWNFPTPWEEVLKAHGAGTIGAVALDERGHFAVCNSTGGASPMLNGRVGDSPIIGCGYHAGPLGAIAATGIGEYIVRQMLCRTVYGWLEGGMSLQAALDRGIALFPEAVPVGLIGVSRTEAATSNNRQMPVHLLEG